MPQDLVDSVRPAPLLTVVRGEPTAAELAALIVVLGGRAEQAVASPRGPVSQWAVRERSVRPALQAGPGAWRASALPR
jgi:acyl-CoA carboxylase epsilon subunit